jgi:septum site-determining protein MinC
VPESPRISARYISFVQAKYMSKIAIISQPDEGVLIDVGGCSSLDEAKEHLISTLKISDQFWKDLTIDLNLGNLSLNSREVAQIIAIAAEVGISPGKVYSSDETTVLSLAKHKIPVGKGNPTTIDEIATRSGKESSKATKSIPEGKEANEEDFDVMIAGPSIDSKPRKRRSVAGKTGTKANQGTTRKDSAKSQTVLYLRQTLRSGQAVSHRGHLVIVGDVNPGAEVMAEGDITVWGALRGMAHAGIGGNTEAEIRALSIQAVQLRIAHAIARSPDRPHTSRKQTNGPETARIVNGTISVKGSHQEQGI